MATLLSGCVAGFQPAPSPEESRRVDLYVAAITAAAGEVEEMAGPSRELDFLAVRVETLEGLSSRGQRLVLEGLKDIGPALFSMKDLRRNTGRFEYKGRDIISVKGGAIVAVVLKQYDGEKAALKVGYWFGRSSTDVIGEDYVISEYKAEYLDGRWRLDLAGRSAAGFF